jgi:murein tripeptide amidase MpaA
MVGIIQAIIENDLQMKILRDEFVFYIFPILNPDGVARGNYRVDTNGINLNRCYINPSAK